MSVMHPVRPCRPVDPRPASTPQRSAHEARPCLCRRAHDSQDDGGAHHGPISFRVPAAFARTLTAFYKDHLPTASGALSQLDTTAFALSWDTLVRALAPAPFVNLKLVFALDVDSFDLEGRVLADLGDRRPDYLAVRIDAKHPGRVMRQFALQERNKLAVGDGIECHVHSIFKYVVVHMEKLKSVPQESAKFKDEPSTELGDNSAAGASNNGNNGQTDDGIDVSLDDAAAK